MIDLLHRAEEMARYAPLLDTPEQRCAFVRRVMAETLLLAAPDGRWRWTTEAAELKRIVELLTMPAYHRDHADLEKALMLEATGESVEAWELLREVLKRHPWKPERVPEERPET